MSDSYTMQRLSAHQIDIPALRQKTALLHSYIEKIRYEERSKVLDRPQTLDWIGNEIEALKDRVDLPQGWTDPEDDFADTAIEVLRLEFAELTRPDNPYPVPADDPRERVPNGKIFRSDVAWPSTFSVDRLDAWDEEGEKWQKFCKGERAARFMLLDSSQIIVVPLQANPPKDGDWIRPEEFWQRVPKAPTAYKWEERSPFDWDKPQETVGEPVSLPVEASGSQVKTFVSALYGAYKSGYIELRCLPAARKEFFNLTEMLEDCSPIEKLVERWTGERQNVFAGVLPRGVFGKSRKADIYQAAVVWAELDFEKQEGEAKCMEKANGSDADLMVLSGGGVHLYWQIDRPIDLTTGNTATIEGFLKKKQRDMGCDPVHDITRILRVPGSMNFKYDPARKVEICL